MNSRRCFIGTKARRMAAWLAVAACVLAVLLSTAAVGQSESGLEKVRIQLKWTHQFQFAGYYAAIEKGFYAEEGLEVSLLPWKLEGYSTAASAYEAVLAGKAEYGVSDMGLMLRRAQGDPVVLLAQIYQRSPHILISLHESGLASVEDLRGKRVMLDTEQLGEAGLLAIIKHRLGSLDSVDVVRFEPDYSKLIRGDVDAMNGYLTNEPFWFRQQGIEVNIIRPEGIGHEFYGDNLFTTEREIMRHPGRAERVRRASIRGWEYALNNPDEIITLLQNKYDCAKTQAHLEYEAGMVSHLILPELIPLGQVDPQRLSRIARVYAGLGVLPEAKVPSGFLAGEGESSALELERKRADQLGLNPSEIAWLETGPSLTFSVDDGYPPLNFREDGGEMQGISIDLVRLAADRLGIEVDFEGSDWPEALAKAMAHQVDGVVNADKLPSREASLSFTDVYAVYPQALVVREGSAPIHRLADCAGMRIAVKPDSSQAAVIGNEAPEAELVPITTIDEGLRLLIEGKVDALFDDLAVTHFHMIHQFYRGLKFGLVYHKPPVGHSRLGLRNDNPLLVSVFNKAIASITPAERRKIEHKWLGFSLPRQGDEPQQGVRLQSEERRWLDRHPVIRVGVNGEMAPLAFQNGTDEVQGMGVDYLTGIGARLGLEFQYLLADSASEQAALIRDGHADMGLNLSANNEREQYLSFSSAYVRFPIVVFGRQEASSIRGLADLAGQRVAMRGDAAVFAEVTYEYPEVEWIAAANAEEGISQVLRGEAGAYVGDLVTADYHATHQGYTNLKVIGNTPYEYAPAFAVRPDWPVLTRLMERAMASMPIAERDAIYKRWIRTDLRPAFPYHRIWQGIAAVAVLVVLVVVWNRRLARLVALRTNALRRNEERLSLALDAAALGAWDWDFTTNEVKVDERYVRMLGMAPEAAENFCYEDWEARVHPEDKAGVVQSLQRHLDGESPRQQAEFRMRTEAGEWIWIQANGEVMERDGGGKPLRMCGTHQDVTERRTVENNYAMLFSRMMSGFAVHGIVCDGEGKPVDYVFLDVNPAFETLTGVRARDIIGKRVTEVFPETEREWIDRYGHVAMTGEPAHFESYSKALDRHFEVMAYRPMEECFACVFVDVTERRQAEEMLRRSETRYRSLFEASNDGVAMLREERLVECNGRMAQMLGLPRHAVMDTSVWEYAPADPEPEEMSLEAFHHCLDAALAGHAREFEWRLCRSGGECFPAELSLTPVRVGEQAYVQLICRDITERKNAEREQRNLEEQLWQSQKMEAIGQLAGGVAHDFNNLLQVINGYTQMLLDERGADKELADALGEVLRAGERAHGLVRQLLTFSRREELKLRKTDISALVQGLLKMIGRVIGEDILLDYVPSSVPAEALADVGQVEQVVMNLCVNARDAMEGGGNLRIAVAHVLVSEHDSEETAGAAAGEYVCITVRDTGSGIPPEVRERIFEPFFTTKEAGRGTGLGLATVYAIVHRHGGFIRVNSGADGTEFTVGFPSADRQAMPALAGAGAYTPVPGGNGEHVLLAEDEEQVGRLATRILEQAGYRVSAAANGKEAIALFDAQPGAFDLALLDVVMPLMNGRQVYEHIRGVSDSIPVVFTTGYSFDVLSREQLPGAGFEVIRKPFTRRALLEGVHRGLSRGQGREG